ncbi:MAG: hypothetical protein OdinLCB4_002285 [Candidatus Odinarchaeum yellowstonii]|uniref:Trm112 family protein n=1 Tax=Odinarchaeota yellowstonii (strain LCB_4) TaxID=1841599 RepID=A0AAF0D329_ODILC|nr:MAG: hypothetical protein OdinLCB4_002285 [Candidatus Odinarchaeum yellowstonii]
MKLWLQNILACPICKSHPLQLIVLKWGETDSSSVGELKKIFLSDVKKKIISPSSIQSIIVLDEDELLNQKVEKLKALFKEFILDYEPEILIKKLGSEMEFIIDVMYRININTGLLKCVECKRWYPIGSSIEGVPEMLPDNLRDKIKDKKFLNLWFDKLPDDLKKDMRLEC